MYLVFAGSTYYPSGGWNDYIGSTTTVIEAYDMILKSENKDWRQIIDAKELSVVARGSN